MTHPLLYGPGFSTYVRTVRLTLDEKQVPYELVEIDFLEGMPEEQWQRHPFGKVPAFDDNGFTLYETEAICRYIDEQYDGPPLQPSAARDRARMTQAFHIIDSYGYNPLITRTVIPRLVVPARGGETDASVIEAASQEADRFLRVMEEIIGGKDYVVGDRLSLADLHLVPVYTYFQLTPDAEPLLENCHNLKHWYNNMRERPSVREHCPAELK